MALGRTVQEEPTPQEAVVVELPEPLVVEAAPAVVRRLSQAARGDAAVQVDLGRVRRVDTFGLAALVAGLRGLRERGVATHVMGAAPEVRRRAALLRASEVLAGPDGRGARGGPDDAGRPRPRPQDAALDRVAGALEAGVVLLAMLYEGARYALPDCLASPLGREHLARQLVEVGARAVPIVAGVTFLIGAIIALQTAYTLEPYGATLYVARGVGISMTRELGPLMAAVLVAARSGSAIAAELGGMVVYEEVEALKMMALRPRRFLLAPRFVALTFAVPALSVCADVAGVLGGAAVMLAQYDIGLSTYLTETVRAVYVKDIASGLIKSLAFGALIAVVACRNGLALQGGNEAVGRAATAAVVQGIVAVVLFDAAFTSASRGVL